MPKELKEERESRKMGSFLSSKFFSLFFYAALYIALYVSLLLYFFFWFDFELQVTSLLWFILRFSLFETFPLKQDVSLPFHFVTNKLKVFLGCFCVIYVNSFPLKDLENTIRKLEVTIVTFVTHYLKRLFRKTFGRVLRSNVSIFVRRAPQIFNCPTNFYPLSTENPCWFCNNTFFHFIVITIQPAAITGR